jgi:cytochrome P450
MTSTPGKQLDDDAFEIGADALDLLDNDPFEEFNKVMGADGDASPYPAFIDARRDTPVRDDLGGMPMLDEVTGDAVNVFTAFSYDAVQAVLGDTEAFSSKMYEEVMGVVFGHSILEMDGDEHHHYRSMIQQAFTRGEMARWEEELVGPLVSRLIDAFVEDGQVDLVRHLLFPFPLMVIAELMGLPAHDFPKFHRLAVELIGVTVDWDRAVEASRQLGEYFKTLIDERRGGDGKDLISVLACVEDDGQHLTDDEIFAFLRLMLPAGAETTYRSSSNLMFGLLSNPDQLAALRDDRSLLPAAIEEGIRWEPPLLLIARGATKDVEVCGTTIPKGATVIVSLASANHDETRWDDPEKFDIFRARKPHIGFAHGPHVCLGMHLARMETRAVITALLDRLPALRFDPTAEAPFISGMTFRAPPRLDVTWG